MASSPALIWTEPALADVDEIAEWIAVRDVAAALALVDRTFAAVGRLRDFPELGRPVPELRGRRYQELIVAPCRIIYRRDRNKISIVLVIRGERRLRRSRLR